MRYDVQVIATDGSILRQQTVRTDTAEAAAVLVTGEHALQRGGGSPRFGTLRAKVYSGPEGNRSMVRFYGEQLKD